MPDKLTLRDSTPEEYAAYRIHVRDGYAEDMVTNGGHDPEEAADKADRDTRDLLPESGLPADQVVKVAEVGAEHVGYLWVGRSLTPGIAWINDIEVRAEFRGQGLGRQLMHEAEGLALDLGYRRIGLNVMGGNTVAITLYDSLGYTVMHQQMVKALDSTERQA